MKKTFLLLFLIFLTNAIADEGMFILSDLNTLNSKKLGEMGLEKTFDWIKDEQSKAVVSLGGGSGSFVSDKGLIITNHHVAYRAIQMNSDKDHDYIENGFYADSFEKELPAPGYYAEVTLFMEDVTERINSKLTENMTGNQRHDTIETEIKKILKEAEAESENIRASVSSMYQGKIYILFRKIRLNDVRLVYAPPASIGEFGGDIDNFEWPRHTGDFSFLRAYSAKDGSPASYSKDNIPYTSKTYLTVSLRPLKKNDFTYILGFPGRTSRYMTGEQIRTLYETIVPLRINMYEEIIDILEEIGKINKENHIRVAGTSKGLNNSLKYYQGVYFGLGRDRVAELFSKRDKQLQNKIHSQNELKKYKHTISDINKINSEIEEIYVSQTLITSMRRYVSLLNAGSTIYKWSLEKQKEDMDRDDAYMDRNIKRTKQRLSSMQKNLIEEKEIRILAYFLNKFHSLDQEKMPSSIKHLFESHKKMDCEKIARDMVTKTTLKSEENRSAYFEWDTEKLKNLNDDMYSFACALSDDIEPLEEKTDKLNGELSKVSPEFVDLLQAQSEKERYPDANSTIRFTYGKICGYSPEEASFFTPFTTLKGAVEKERGKIPFINPEKLLNLYAEKDFGEYADPYLDNEVPLNFLSDVDTTGGNSGSPTFNGKGELIGLLFDGNFESISADYYFNPRMTRSIIVDSRYIFFILDKYSSADTLINEMTTVK